jgi:hypothetical protein
MRFSAQTIRQQRSACGASDGGVYTTLKEESENVCGIPLAGQPGKMDRHWQLAGLHH